jgi:hypothetical protein
MKVASMSLGRSGIGRTSALQRAAARLCVILLLTGTAAVLSGCGATSEKSVRADQKEPDGSAGAGGLLSRLTGDFTPVRIPSGTSIHVRLLGPISSQTASPGESFDADLTAPIEVNRSLVFPRGCPARVQVVSVRPSGRLHDSGFLQLTLDSIRTAGGQWVPVTTTSVSAHGKSHDRRNLTLIGGGTGVGAAIGALAGGGKGAAIGAGSGAAAGTAGAYATGRKDVVYSAESKLTFRTVSDIVMSR